MKIIKIIKKYVIYPIANYITYKIIDTSKKHYRDYTDEEHDKYWDREIKITAKELWDVKLQKFRKRVDVNTYLGAMEFVKYIIKDK
jgi:hypothetical protein